MGNFAIIDPLRAWLINGMILDSRPAPPSPVQVPALTPELFADGVFCHIQITALEIGRRMSDHRVKLSPDLLAKSVALWQRQP
jgi:hypothetical protein